MDLTQLANLGEFVGGIAVLVTLVYLGIQVKQGNRLTTAQVLQESARVSTDLLMNANARDLDLMVRAFADPDSVDESDRRVVGARFLAIVNYYENLFYARERGEVDDDHWESRRQRMANFLTPAKDSFWPRLKMSFGKRFRDFVDQELLPNDATSISPWLPEQP